MSRSGRLMMALGDINGKYIKGAERNMSASLIKIAVSLALICALGLVLFLPFSPVTSDISAYLGSEYYPLIEEIEDYRLSLMQPKYKNNFEAILAGIDNFGFAAAPGGSSPDNMEESTNGDYLETTDNQVEGVIESDLMKMTDKYIFRLGYTTKPGDINYTPNYVVRVYSVDKEDSALVSEFVIQSYENQKRILDAEMYLSLDGNTITVVNNFNDSNGKSKVGIISIDVSDILGIKENRRVIIDGSLNTSRMADGKLLLVTEYVFNRKTVDYSDLTTFVPTINHGNGARPIEFEDIIFPDKVGNTRYSVVALLDAESLTLMGANALLNFVNDVYVSENNVYITREYNERTENEDGGYTSENMTDVAVLNYSGDKLEQKGIITICGWAEDQYSFDEKDGFLRVVTSTTEGDSVVSGDIASFRNKRNASLYIYNLADNSLAYKVEDFAPEGEEATAVRFRGDKLYVCTAVVVTFTDPVYFFDLSDYENITYTDTGIIEGYSEHLIDYGEGFTLGIGEEDWQYSKVEIYEERDGAVVAVDEFKFVGQYSTDYKAYLVNREENLFGFGVNGYYEEGSIHNGASVYILLHFNGYEFTHYIFNVSFTADNVRAVYIDGYLYITTPFELFVEPVN